MMSTHAEPGTPIKHRFTVLLSKDCCITTEKMKEHGLHPMCEACLTRRAEECRYPQYNAKNLLLFRCLDFK